MCLLQLGLYFKSIKLMHLLLCYILQALYEAVCSDRNLCSKHLIEARDEITEMKRKLKIMSHQIDQLKEEIASKVTNGGTPSSRVRIQHYKSAIQPFQPPEFYCLQYENTGAWN